MAGFELAESTEGVVNIKVIGTGGGGCNAVMLLPLSSGSRTKRLRLWLPTTTVLPRVWPANWTPC